MELNRVYNENCVETMRRMPDGYIDCVVTSPPYYGLRDYGTATWGGGDASCDHINSLAIGGQGEASKKQHTSLGTQLMQYKDVCGKCGAKRVDEQFGLEDTPEAFVNNLVGLFREIRRAMKDTGTVWLNIGDSYAGGAGRWGGTDPETMTGFQSANKGSLGQGKPKKWQHNVIKPKDLIGVPWRVAFALQADGWYLRQDIIWHKPNPMPESVTDRCTKSHEYIFLLTKSQRYFYDAEAVKEKAATLPHGPGYTTFDPNTTRNDRTTGNEANERAWGADGNRNKRSVWTVTTKPYKEAHFATFPESLIVPCIKAGCPEGGIVYDPFMGSGTTALVSHKLNRNWIGSELNPEYVKIAEKRLKPFLTQYKMF